MYNMAKRVTIGTVILLLPTLAICFPIGSGNQGEITRG